MTSQENANKNYLILFAVITATFLEVLDSTVVNVSLPYISGTLSVTSTETAWGVLAYLCSNAAMLPLAGPISRKLGKRRAFILSLAAFVFMSALCSSSTSLVMFTIWRAFQGASGAIMQPLAYSTALQAFPNKKQSIGIAILGFVTTLAPAIGPVLGGWLTEAFGWQVIFLINVPIALVILLILILHYWPEDTLEQTQNLHLPSVFVLLAGTLLFQIILMRGDYYGWHRSLLIVSLSIATLGAYFTFVLFQWTSRNPLLNLRKLMDASYLTGCILIVVHNIVFIGSTLLLPLLLEEARGLSSYSTGLYILPRGIGSLLGMMIARPLLEKLNTQSVIIGSQLAIAGSLLWLASFPLDVNGITLCLPQILAGIGSAVGYVAIASLTFSKLSEPQTVDASACFSYMATIGGSLGVTTATTVLTWLERQVLTNFTEASSFYGRILLERQHTLFDLLHSRHGHVTSPMVQSFLFNQLTPQVHLVATNLLYRYMAVTIFCLVACMLLLILWTRIQLIAGRFHRTQVSQT